VNAFASTDNLRFYLEKLINELEANGLEKTVRQYHRESLIYLLEKQRNYSGAVYQDQLEKNTIYLAEAGGQVIVAAAIWLWRGEPRLNPAAVPGFVDQLRIPAQADTPLHLKYLREGCKGCLAHDQHRRWENLQNLRRTASHGDYIDELEFLMVYYQTRFRVLQSFMTALLTGTQWAGAARLLQPGTVAEVIENRINPRLSLYTGLSKQLTQAEKAQTNSSGKTPWRVFWGPEFDLIARSSR